MGIVFILFLAYPFVELYALVKIAQATGVFTALLGVFALSIIGASVLRRIGLKAWRRVGEEVASGKDPSARMIDGVIVLVAGILLVMPGYVTGALGLLLLLPPSRVLLRGLVKRRAQRFSSSGTTFVYGGSYVDGDVIDVSGEIRPPEEDK